jgi:nuclear RNA export factor
LDGETLPPQIGFDVGDTKLQVPDSVEHYLPEEIKEFVYSFLQQFFQIYDSTDRQQLIAAYHEHATFSFSISKVEQGNPNTAFAGDVLSSSRNLLRIDMSKRTKLVKQGHLNVISYLKEFPLTEHKAESFSIDVPFQSNSMIVLVINGIYLEHHKNKNRMPRFFCRMFTIVPQAGGFVIINDQLMVGSATNQQKMKYEVKPDAQMNSVSSLGSSGSSSSTLNTMKDENKLIEAFALDTKMTAAFSRQCLEENNYDFNAAIEVFRQLNKMNMIPQEAFARR